MNPKTAILTVAVAILCVAGVYAACASLNSTDQPGTDDTTVSPDIGTLLSEYEDVVNLDGMEWTEIEQALAGSTGSDVLYASSSTLDTIVLNDATALKDAVESGVPFLVSGDMSSLLMIGMTVTVNPEADFSVIYHDLSTGNTTCFGIDSDEPSALHEAMRWLEDARASE